MSSVPRDFMRNRLLRAMAPADFEALQPRLEAVDLPLRDVLVETGRRVEHLHFLSHGLASVVVTSEDNEQIEVGHVGREGLTGAQACLCVTRSETRTFMQVAGGGWRIAAEDFDRFVDARPAVRTLLLRYVYTQQMQVAYSALANARYNLRECLARWLLMSQDRLEAEYLPLTHEFLSLMIGVRRAGVTGELTILEGMGVVRATRGSIRVLDRERLLGIAGGCYGQPEAIYDKLIGPVPTSRHH